MEVGRQRGGVGAVIDLDGSMLGEAAGFEDGIIIYDEEPYPVPLLDVYSEDHFTLITNVGDEYCNTHTLARAAEAYRAVLYGAGHMNFTDLPLFSPYLANVLAIGTSQPGWAQSTAARVSKR